MQGLHDRFNRALQAGQYEPLLMIPAYVLDFLCIHPFLDVNGRPRKLLLHGDHNGFFYVLDRLNGEVLLAEPFAKNLTWASGERHRPGRPSQAVAGVRADAGRSAGLCGRETGRPPAWAFRSRPSRAGRVV